MRHAVYSWTVIGVELTRLERPGPKPPTGGTSLLPPGAFCEKQKPGLTVFPRKRQRLDLRPMMNRLSR